MEPLQTTSSASMHVGFRQVVSAFSSAFCPLFFLRGFIALKTSELSIIKSLFSFSFPFFSDSNLYVFFFKCWCKWVLPPSFLVSCHNGQEGGRSSAPLLGGAVVCDQTGQSLVTGRGLLFPFCCCCCCMKTVEQKSGGSRGKKEHGSAFSSELHQYKVWLCVAS